MNGYLLALGALALAAGYTGFVLWFTRKKPGDLELPPDFYDDIYLKDNVDIHGRESYGSLEEQGRLK